MRLLNSHYTKEVEKTSKKIALALLFVLAFLGAIQAALATSITTASLDKTAYLAGQTGYISATIYNDKNEKIRVTELSATVNYYYVDGTVYIQKFFTSASLPWEIPAGESETFQIPISLPTNIAHGYTNPRVEAYTDIWRTQDDRWMTSDHPTYSNLKLYIETPYKQAFEEEQATNNNLTNTTNLLSITTLIFAAAAGLLLYLVFARRPRPAVQS
jgi:hypothetical protein